MPFEYAKLPAVDRAAIRESFAANVVDDPVEAAWNAVMGFLQYHSKGNLLAFVLSAYIRNRATVGLITDLIDPTIEISPLSGKSVEEIIGIRASFGSRHHEHHVEAVRRDYLYGNKYLERDIREYFERWNGLMLGRSFGKPDKISEPEKKTA